MGLAPYGQPDLPGRDPRAPDRPQGRRQLLAGHGVLQLLPGPDDDQPALPRPVRRPAAAAGIATSSSGTWTWRRSIQAVTEEVMLRIGRHVHRQTGHEEPGPGRRRGAQLRGQRPAPARRAVRGHLDSAGGRRRRRRAGRGPVRLAPAARQAAARRSRTTRSRAASSGPRSPTDEIEQFLDRSGASPTAHSTTRPSCSSTSPALLAEGKVVGWFQGRMEFGPRPWAPAASSATRARRDAGDDEPQDQVPRELPAVRPVRPARARRTNGSTCSPARRARTCCWSRRSASSTARRIADADAADRWQTTPTCGSASTWSAPRSRPSRTSITAPACRPSTRAATRASTGCSQAFHARTGCPVLVNTSFNVRGEPIVCTPAGRLPLLPGRRTWTSWSWRDCVIVKDEAARDVPSTRDRQAYLAQFQLD